MSNLFDIMLRDAIGYDTLSQKFGGLESSKYPPHNIVKFTDNKYKIQLAVAGFTKTELQVQAENGLLTVIGKKVLSETTETSSTLYRGISSRDFNRSWKMGEYVEVTGVKLENGLLEISLERNVPDQMKAKSYDIN